MTVQDYELLLRVRADLQQALTGLDGMRKKLDTVGTETERTSQRASKAVGRMEDKFKGLKGLIAGLAVGAGIKAVLDAVTESENAVAQLRATLKSTGNAAGLTESQLVEFAGSLQQVTTYGDDAIIAMESVLGTFTALKGPVYKDAVVAILDISAKLGTDLKASAIQVGKALNDPVKGISALAEVGVSFTQSQKEVVAQLVKTGDVAGAQKIILDELKTEFGGAAEAAGNTFGGSLKQLQNAFGDLLEGDGGNLPEATASVKELTKTLQDPSVKAGFAAIVDGLISVVTYAANAIGYLKSFKNVVVDALSFGPDAQKSLDALYSKRADLEHTLEYITKFSADKGADPEAEKIRKQIAALDLLIQRKREASEPVTSAPGAPAPAAPAGNTPQVLPDLTVFAPAAPTVQATESISKFIAAGTSLQQKLIDMQAAINPTAKAWADYNKVVAQTNAQADDALKAPKANAAAINGERDAIIQLAAAARDADLKKIADADRQAFDQLRDSLRTPAEVQLETAAQQIQQLNQYLRDGVISSKEYHDAISAVAVNSVGNDLPQYQGVDAAVGGVGSELSKNFAAEQTLNDAYAQKLAANEAFRAQDSANEEVYQQRLAALQEQYATQRNSIEQSRQQLQIQATSDFFGNLAQLQHSSNSKVAAVGKAAAIAQAIIQTYVSANNAFAALSEIPIIGPALGAAAAAAAIATGLANVAAIRSQPTGFSEGGYTGPGGVNQPAGVVHAGEVVWSQKDVARVGGVSVAEALRLGRLPAGYSAGGLVMPANSMPAAMDSLEPTQQISSAPAGQQKHVHLWDKDQAAQEIASTTAFEDAVLHVVGTNPGKIKGKWGNG